MTRWKGVDNVAKIRKLVSLPFMAHYRPLKLLYLLNHKKPHYRSYLESNLPTYFKQPNPLTFKRHQRITFENPLRKFPIKCDKNYFPKIDIDGLASYT